MYVYAYYNNKNEVMYVGSSKHPVNRFQTHQKEDIWMQEVTSITIWGPYRDKDEGSLCERALVSALTPKYNINLTTYNVDAPILHEQGTHFSNLSDMKKHFKQQPDVPSRYTLYLQNVDVEALRLLSFYDNENISELAGNILRRGIQEMATTIGHPDIFGEARSRLLKGC